MNKKSHVMQKISISGKTFMDKPDMLYGSFTRLEGHHVSGLILGKLPTSPSPILMEIGVLKLTFLKLSSVKF